ncbi:DUF2188 domain-containing protein [Microvirga antarctica]|uniref:DUF2188 domain-containing protein n=1 Tax=Microvirga antarctica TaxID=2819233 RepID=UPI001B3099C6|nr:DUF2188 domain-containing protein [Microvirga antarctica]
MSKRARHVIASPSGRWSVRLTGASRASKTFDSQAAAVKYAKESAKKDGTELYVHRRDGTVRNKDSYGASIDTARDRR